MDAQILCGPGTVIAEERQGSADLGRLIIPFCRLSGRVPGVHRRGGGAVRSGQTAGQVRKGAADILQVGAFLLAQDTDALAEILTSPACKAFLPAMIARQVADADLGTVACKKSVSGK